MGSFFGAVLNILVNNWPMFISGAGVTLLIASVGTIVGTFFGLIIGVIRTIPIEQKDLALKKVCLKTINFILSAYIEIFRGTPMMVQAMVIYYGFAYATQVSLDPLMAGMFIVSVNTGAYMAEIVRGGILSIDKGQFEAAHSCGMTHWQTMTNIVLPQAFRNILPAIGNEFVINIKDTSVLNVIMVSELYFNSTTIAGNSFKFFQVFFITCVIYFVLTFTITRILRFIEKQLAGSNTYTIHGSQTVPEAEIKIQGRQ